MRNNTKDALMKKVQQYAFVAHECVLYLDGHPNNKQALKKHSEAVKAMKEAVAQYEGMYGPLTADNAGGVDWNWVKTPWPWQNN